MTEVNPDQAATLIHYAVQAADGEAQPAVLLGSKHRFIGLAYLAAGQPAAAAMHLARAANENSEFPVLHTRTRFDLARALVRQSASRDEGVAEMERVEHRAAELGMAGLAAQAAAERDHWSRPEP